MPTAANMIRPSTADVVVSNIKLLLGITGWNVPRLEKESGVPRRTIYSIINKERVPGIDTTDEIAKAFGLTGWQLLMPNLHYDIAKSGRLNSLIEDFSESSKATQEFIADVLQRERKQ